MDLHKLREKTSPVTKVQPEKEPFSPWEQRRLELRQEAQQDLTSFQVRER